MYDLGPLLNLSESVSLSYNYLLQRHVKVKWDNTEKQLACNGTRWPFKNWQLKLLLELELAWADALGENLLDLLPIF